MEKAVAVTDELEFNPLQNVFPAFITPIGRFHIPDHARLDAALSIGQWSTFAPIIQAQVVQKTKTLLEVRLVTERKLREEEQMALANYLSERLFWKFEYQFTYHDSLHRGRNRKFEDFISELG